MKYDYIITGSGCAGLSLVYLMSQTEALSQKRILLIDKEEKNKNDRTWSFWEAEEGLFEPIVFHAWKELFFKSSTLDKSLDIAPFQYKMIRGLDFYTFVLNALKQHPNIHLVYEAITDIQSQAKGATVTTDKNTYEANWVFNSLLPKNIDYSNSNYIAQHFGGWLIQTDKPTFNPKQAILMDFRIPQAGETRFMYVLPTSENTALLEATAFSNQLLTEADYDAMILDYIQAFTKIETYSILHKELGVIPMTDYPFQKHATNYIVPIGTAGGQVKASTGYAFTRIQKHTKQIVNALKDNQSPHIKPSALEKRFAFFDSILLNVMLKNSVPAATVFSLLFQRNRASTVLEFLNENTSLFQDIQIMNSVPIWPFMKAAFREMY